MRNESIGVEQLLADYAQREDPRLREKFKHIPPYLRDLIYKASAFYTNIPSCYMQLVTELLAQSRNQVLLILLNYYNLLESALTRFDRETFVFGAFGDYIRPERQAQVVKLHGSVDWFMNVGGKGLTWDQGSCPA